MSRRGSRRGSSGRGLSNGRTFSPQTLGGLVAWYRADSLITQVAGPKVSAWGDLRGGDQDVSQGTDANRPAYTAADANFRNKPTVSQGAATLALLDNTAADWKFLHDGTGCTVFCVVRPSNNAAAVQILWDTTVTTGAANVGACLFYDGPNDRFRYFVGNGTTNILNTPSSNNSSPQDTTQVVICRYQEGRAPSESDVRARGVTAGSENTSGAPSAANPAGALAIGALGNLTAGFFGVEAELAFYNRVLTDGECALLEAYAAARYGTT